MPPIPVEGLDPAAQTSGALFGGKQLEPRTSGGRGWACSRSWTRFSSTQKTMNYKLCVDLLLPRKMPALTAEKTRGQRETWGSTVAGKDHWASFTSELGPSVSLQQPTASLEHQQRKIPEQPRGPMPRGRLHGSPDLKQNSFGSRHLDQNRVYLGIWCHWNPPNQPGVMGKQHTVAFSLPWRCCACWTLTFY